MTTAAPKASQKNERRKLLETILQSTESKKLIVAGPGTGKTFTFKELLKSKTGGTNLAMTFIRKLVEDLEGELGDYAEVKTFHAYCKKVLHERRGRVELVPYLSKVIEQDSKLLGNGLGDFDTSIRTLDESSDKLDFYLRRGDYYKVVGFDDAVYRLLRILREDPDIIPEFDQIVIDEFQDFNPLEVAFIRELEKKGSILIVGDDDQAVYAGRAASATYLRKLYKSGRYKTFELPYCSRCPQVIVDATNAILNRASSQGYLKDRIAKRYECYLEAKEADSQRYPKILVAECTTSRVIPKYIKQEIAKVHPRDVKESNKAAAKYPTVLIVGQRQYLREVEKQLRTTYPTLSYLTPQDTEYGFIHAYEQILRDKRSNFGWRILMELCLPVDQQKDVLRRTQDGVPMMKLLDPRLVAVHLEALEIIKSFKDDGDVKPELRRVLKKAVGDSLEKVIQHFGPSEEEKEVEPDETEPSILLTSYVGSKGLSAGHVFIVGVHNESIPKDSSKIRDIEISQFVVALTRTRKQCHIISNQWLISPKDKHGQWLPRFEKSTFISWIPESLIEDRGLLKRSDFK
jgi:superfamily I DNA/RNA helicase